jgi:uncharacterized membrane protein
VTGSLTPGEIGVVIPEFTMLLMPVIGVTLIFVFARRKFRNY